MAHDQEHTVGGDDHLSSTLAELNAKISDADVDDAGDPRTPTSHADTHDTNGTDPFTATDLLEAVVKRLQESGGPTDLTLGEVEDGEALVRNGTTLEGAAISFAGQYFDGYDGTGGTSVSGWTDVPLNAERKKTSAFIHTSPSAEVEIDTDDTYIIIGRVSVNITAGGRADSQVRLAIDTGGGYAEVPGTLGFIYNRNAAQGVGTAVVFAIVDLSDGDKIKLQASPRGGTGTYVLPANGSGLMLFTSRGPKGDKGDTGSGSSITLEDEGVPVPNTPHSTINFTGNVSVSDAGGGEATVDIPAPTFGSGYQYGSSDTQSDHTGDTNWTQKLRLTTPSLPGGTYRIGYSYELAMSNISDAALGRVQINDTTTIHEAVSEMQDSTNWLSFSGFYHDTLSGIQNIDIDYATPDTGQTVSIRRARLEIWRVA